MSIIKSILTNNDCYKSGRTIAVKGLMLHSVGCNQPSAMVFIRNWNKPASEQGGREVCVHGFVDGNTGDTYQCLPWNYRGWHGGGSSNNTHIGVEMCEPACIKYTGGSSFTCSDTLTAKAVAKRTYDAAVELFAFLCKEYGLNPLGDGVIVSHREGCTRGIASNHGDPEHLWNQLNTGYTMNGFRNAVKVAMSGGSIPETPSADVLYRVQVGAYSVKANADEQLEKVKSAGFDTYMAQVNELYKIQVGAYSEKENADAMLNKLKTSGFDAFITTQGGTADVPNTPEPNKKTIDELANEVINGQWGNGDERKQRLSEAGYDYSAVQDAVNAKCGAASKPSKKSVTEIAKEVMRGDWGNGQDRKNRLAEAGYNYSEVQTMVNKLLG